jgi:guanosine-diphosphatase
MQTALKSVPEQFRAQTPISLKATAGLRLLGQGQGDKILEKVREYLATFPFDLHDPKKSVEVMDGKDEGVFAWITVNYLLGYLDPSKGKKTAAIMDLGGGSTQIVFEPFNDIPDGSHKVQVPFGNKTYTLYQKSYDGFGLMQGRKKSMEKGGCASKTHSTCLDLLGSLFDKHNTCHLAPCSFAGVYMPPLEEHFYDGEIYAFSYFYDVYAEPYGKVQGGFKVGHVYEAVKVSCANDPEHHECLDLGFIYSLLKVGYDLPKSRHLLTAKKINGIETGWALGAALALLNEKPTS